MSNANKIIEIEAQLKTDKLEAKEAEWKQRIHQLNEELNSFSRRARQTVRSAMTAISASVSAIRSVFNAFGIAMPRVFDAVLSAVTTTVASLQAIAAAYAAGGVTAYLTPIVEGAAIMLSMYSVMAVAQGQRDVSSQFSQMNAALRGIGISLNAWGRVTSEWSD